MINLRNSPFLWLALVLLLTCVLGAMLDSINWRLFLLITLSGLALSSLLAFLSYSHRHYYWSTIGITMVIVFAGLANRRQFNESHFPTPLMTNSVQVRGIVEVAEVLKIKHNRISLRCIQRRMLPLADTSSFLSEDRYILVQVRDPGSLTFLPGDIIHATGWISAISGPLNPHSFDARQYYLTLSIRHQLSCKAEDVTKQNEARKTIQRLTATWQRNLSTIVRHNTSPESAQVINALVWGDRSDMDEEVRDAFADSGAMHVLSVSGMHVAMIYSLLMLLLGAPGDGTFVRRLVRFMCYAVAILLYVGLTGACPAVVRAGLMILLYLFGKSMGWNTQVWNLIGFAAFMMLWLNPYLYLNIGFQLSFLAMAGILLYARPIIRSLAFKYKLAHWTWEIVALSLAAQVFILPVILGQFHQFPLTFIISSIVAIPAGYIVIFGAILNVLLSVMQVDLLWPLLDTSCLWFVNCMKWMAGLNPSMHYSMPGLIGAFLMIISLLYSFALIYRWPMGKQVSYSLCGVMILSFGWHRLHVWKEDEIIIYHSYLGIVIDVFRDGYVYNIADRNTTPAQIEFPTRGYRCHRDVIDTKRIILEDEFRGHSFNYHDMVLDVDTLQFLLYSQQYQYPMDSIHPTHIILLDCRDTTAIKPLLQSFPNADIILAASFPRRDHARMTTCLSNQHRTWYDISSQGFFKIPI